MLWTTAQGAQAAEVSPSGFRALVSRAASAGVDLRAPRHTWPDARTPLYDGHAVFAYLASRPGRGRRSTPTPAPAPAQQLDVDQAEAVDRGEC